MEEKVHRIRSAGREFTRQQWYDYLDSCRGDDRNLIVTNVGGKFIFNDHDICINPDVDEIVAKSGAFGYYVHIKTAYCGNGLWSYGIDYSTGTGGGGFGVSFADKKSGEDKDWRVGYPSERECKVAAAQCAIRQLHPYNGNDKLVNKLKELVEEYIKDFKRPKYVQLELF